MDPFVQVTIHVPDWTSFVSSSKTTSTSSLSTLNKNGGEAKEVRVTQKTRVVKRNGFNPVWQETMSLPFDCVGGPEMRDLVFVEFSVRQEGREAEDTAGYCAPLGCFEMGESFFPVLFVRKILR